MPKRSKSKGRAERGEVVATLEVPLLSYRVAMVPETWDRKRNTVEVVWATGEGRALDVDDYLEPFWEVLGFEPGMVRMGRLERGAPLLDSHGRPDFMMGGVGLRDQLGVVERAWLEPNTGAGEGHASLRILDHDDDLTRRVRAMLDQGIIQNLSHRYRVYAYSDAGFDERTGLPIRRAIDWEPQELSFLPVPADENTRVRSATRDVYPVRVYGDTRMAKATKKPARARAADAPEPAPKPSDPAVLERERCLAIRSAVREAELDDELADEWIKAGHELDKVRALVDEKKKAKGNGADDPSPAPGGTPESVADPEAVRSGERTRCLEIQRIGQRHKLDEPFVSEHLRAGTSLDRFRALAMDRLAEAEGGKETTNVRVETEEGDKIRAGVENALAHRCRCADDKGVLVPLSDAGREFRGMTLLRVAEEVLSIRGVRVRGLAPMEIAYRALHTTDDFPELLENIANKRLMNGFTRAPRSFLPWTRGTTLSDFKTTSIVGLGEGPALVKLEEGADIKWGTLGDKKETYALLTYARAAAFTRQALVNDDMSGFDRIPRMWGFRAAELESDVVYAILTANANMSDGTPLFHADHANLVATAGLLDETGLSNARELLRKQTGIDGARINPQPAFLIVPPELETAAFKQTASVTPDSAGNVNPFSSVFNAIIVDPRLGALPWYMTAEPDNTETIEYAHLTGRETPVIESWSDMTKDGLAYRVIHDFAALAVDHRGMVKSDGVA